MGFQNPVRKDVLENTVDEDGDNDSEVISILILSENHQRHSLVFDVLKIQMISLRLIHFLLERSFLSIPLCLLVILAQQVSSS